MEYLLMPGILFYLILTKIPQSSCYSPFRAEETKAERS